MDAEKLYWSSRDADCGMCGSHGDMGKVLAAKTKRKRIVLVAKLTGITVDCGDKNDSTARRSHEVDAEKLYWSSRDADCGMCGSHGNITVGFECEYCGVEHQIKIREW